MAELSILFVDDEDLIRKSFTRDLREEHFAVTAVGSGNEAIDLLKNQLYDLVITDLLMPGIDGLGVLKAVKEYAPQTSVIIITGYGDMQSAVEALRLGADDFAIKPCEIEEVVFRIRRCQEKRSLLQMLSAQNLKLEREIAHRQKIEAELIESDTRFRLALDASSNETPCFLRFSRAFWASHSIRISAFFLWLKRRILLHRTPGQRGSFW